MKQELKVDVYLDAKTYRSYSFFDRFIRTGGWRRPLFFLLGFCALAGLSFFMAARGNSGAWLLGAALLFVGLLLPSVHIYNYLRGVKALLDRFGLKGDSRRLAYTLSLNEDRGALLVYVKGQNPARYSWKKMEAVYQRGDLLLIYPEPAKAFILPLKALGEQAGQAKALIQQAIPTGRYRG